LVLPAPAWAHAFGARYDLPLPLWLYLTGAGATVALTFILAAVFLRQASARGAAPQIDLSATWFGRLAVHPALLDSLRGVAVGLFLLILATGLAGKQDSFDNLAPTFVWVIWWVGLAFVSALLGDLWALINPWKTLFGWAEALYRRLRPDRALSLGLAYPPALGVWPSVVLFLAFIWIELVSESGEVPAGLAQLILLYSAFTWTGMFLFGRQVWLRHAEVFSVFFGLLARFAPLQAKSSHQEDGGMTLVPFGAGLLTERPVSVSMTVFVVLTLATVSFDGFRETTAWTALLEWIGGEPAFRGLLLWLREVELNALKVVMSSSLVLAPALFLAVYLFFARMTALAGGGRGLFEVAGFFVLSLVPIAIAYHIAHYLSFLLLAGQLIVPLASDPFGFGWNLFGTVNVRMDVSVVSARMIWFVAVAMIVLGHAIAVCLAHVMALRVFGDRRAALRSQVPMLVLMVGYTMISLWILSQPIVNTG
jgi:hypothetical protein